MQNPLRSLKTRGGNSLTAILIFFEGISAMEDIGMILGTKININSSIFFIILSQ
jgi:hypothetical protein